MVNMTESRDIIRVELLVADLDRVDSVLGCSTILLGQEVTTRAAAH